jgi:hypothetical protein
MDETVVADGIDWEVVRGSATDCLNAAWSMALYFTSSQQDEFDDDKATAQLAEIERARVTYRRAFEILRPGLECADKDVIRRSPVFDALLLALPNDRPNLPFATAHETAFESLRAAMLQIENRLNDLLDELEWPDECVAGIGFLHTLSPEALGIVLVWIGQVTSKLNLTDVRAIRTWIDREWAAVRANARTNVIVLKSGDIRDRYHLTVKQIRDWAKDDRKPFITPVAGQRKYEINPDHPELVALAK